MWKKSGCSGVERTSSSLLKRINLQSILFLLMDEEWSKVNTVKVIQEDNGITWIVLNREEMRNAINHDVIDELEKALLTAEHDDSKLVVLTGEGNRAFCSGGDLSTFQHLQTAKEAKKMLEKMGTILEKIAFFPKITVAALNGIAVGGGSELASACDFRIGTPACKVGFVQATLGITTGWGGSTLLFEKVAVTEALNMLLSARMYTSEELLHNGFLQSVIEDESFKDGVISYVEPFLQHSKEVVLAYKSKLVNRYDKNLIHENIQKEIRECARLWESAEHHEAVQAFLNRPKNN